MVDAELANLWHSLKHETLGISGALIAGGNERVQ